MPKRTKTRKILLEDVPENVYLFLLKEQNKIKEEKRLSQFSLERTLYCVLKSHPDYLKCKDCQ